MEYVNPLYVKILTTLFLGTVGVIVIKSFFKAIKDYVVDAKLKKYLSEVKTAKELNDLNPLNYHI
jgi:hypothetical protein